jgi:hypothetical protein
MCQKHLYTAMFQVLNNFLSGWGPFVCHNVRNQWQSQNLPKEEIEFGARSLWCEFHRVFWICESGESGAGSEPVEMPLSSTPCLRIYPKE